MRVRTEKPHRSNLVTAVDRVAIAVRDADGARRFFENGVLIHIARKRKV